MKIDELRRGLDDAGRRDIDVVEARAAVGEKTVGRRRRNHQLVGIVTVTVIAAIAVPIAVLRDDPKATVRVGPQPVEDVKGWAQISKTAAGLPAHASFAAIASTDRSFVLGGSERGFARIWYSDDGRAWNRAHLPLTIGPADDYFVVPTQVHAVATSGHSALAIGSDSRGLVPFVWRSGDDGHTWRLVSAGAGLFGPPATEMGRPFVDGLSYANGEWIASGGASSGYAGVWTSNTGEQWQQVLDTRPGPPNTGVGSVNIVADAFSGQLLAYGGNVVWKLRVGTTWDAPVVATVPEPFFLNTVAPGATIAFGDTDVKHGQPTPLLRRAGAQQSWAVEPAFLEEFPTARVANVTRQSGVWIASGWSDSPNHPDAWVSTDGANWDPIPPAIHGEPGGILDIAGSLSGRIVVFGSDPQLDRYYTFDIPKSTSSENRKTQTATYLTSPPYTRGIEVGRTWPVGTLRIESADKAVFTLNTGLSATYVRDNLPQPLCN